MGFDPNSLRSPPFGADDVIPSDDEAFMKAAMALPALLVEVEGKRELVSLERLSSFDEFWIVDCQSYNSIESVLRELPGDLSISALSIALGSALFSRPKGNLLSLWSTPDLFTELIFNSREVSEMRLSKVERRIDLRWTRRGVDPMWLDPDSSWPKPSRRVVSILAQLSERYRYRNRRAGAGMNCSLYIKDARIIDADDITVVQAFGHTYFLASPIQQYFVSRSLQSNFNLVSDAYWFALEFCISISNMTTDAERYWFDNWVPLMREVGEGFDMLPFLEAVRRTAFKPFATTLWARDE
jgi:hypothetical protein